MSVPPKFVPSRGTAPRSAKTRVRGRRSPLLLALMLGLTLQMPGAAMAQSQSTTDDQRLRAMLDALEDRAYDLAVAAAGALRDPVAQKLVVWSRYKDGLGVFDSIVRFMEDNPHWPHQYGLRRAAERSLTGREDPVRLLAWFDRNPPLTTDGLVARARALQAVGRSGEVAQAAREAWVEGRFSQAEQDQFYSAFRSVLRTEDHERRIAELIWNERLSEAQRMYPLVSEGQRALAEARIQLIRDNPGVDGAIERVPANLRDDPGLVFDRMVWRRKHGLFARAVELLSHPSANKGDPDAWAGERAVLAREALDQGNARLAYAIAAAHGHESGLAFATGEWTAGWIALRFLNQPSQALTHFETMHAGVAYPQSASRAAYWAGRAAQAMGQRDRAVAWYRQAAEHAETFYGQLAIEALGESLAQHLEARPAVTDADRARFAADDRVRVIQIMDRVGRADLALPFALALNDDSATPGFRLLAGEFLAGTGRPDMAVFFARRAALAGTMLPQVGYPAPPAVVQALAQQPPTGPRPEPALLLSLIRQESNFNAEAISSAGARGLMQLMPRTARDVAGTLGVPYTLESLTDNPALNVRFGSTYFAGLLQEFGGSYVLSIAGYNAGPHRSRRWRAQNGDPRRMTTEEVIDWIERIPFNETRNYVQRVLEGTQVYRHRLGQGSAGGTLSADLRR